MGEGWTCPVCGRGLAPWVAVCPCHEAEEFVAEEFVTGARTSDCGGCGVDPPVTTSIGPCGFLCDNKTELGYCKTTACINPDRYRF